MIGRLTWGFVGLGLALRVGAYLLDFPLWWDEAFVAVNLLRRDALGLLGPLDYGQVAPLLFLWGELASVRVLGFSEWSLRLVPCLAALASVPLFRLVAVKLLEPRAALAALAIFAVSIHPIRHAADLKPYSLDLLAALALQGLALWWWQEPQTAGRLLTLAGVVPLALACSHPSAFVAGGVGMAIAWPAWKTGLWSVRLAALAYALAASIAWVGLYLLFARSQSAAASEAMRVMWTRSFPPADSFPALLGWLAVVHTGDLMAYPCGGESGGSILSLFATMVGVVALVRSGRGLVASILLAPFGLAMVAAALRLYPYGGPAPHGSAARVMQYAAPALCLLIGLGASRLLRGDRPFRLGLVGLVVVGLVPLVEGLRQPYRAYQAEASRRFARGFWPEVEAGAEVASLRWDFEGVADWDSIHLGVAVALCDEAINSPSRKRGGPRWGAVSADRPLRCVLEVASPSDRPRVEAWLERMKADFLLTRRRSTPVNTAEPGRAPRLEVYEVYEFLPKVRRTVVPPDAQAVKGSYSSGLRLSAAGIRPLTTCSTK